MTTVHPSQKKPCRLSNGTAALAWSILRSALAAALFLLPLREAPAQNFGVQPQAAQLTMMLNNALKADMNPAFRQQFDQAYVDNIMRPMYTHPTGNYVQQAYTSTKQLTEYYERQSGDDNHRAVLCLMLTWAPMAGQSAESIRQMCLQATAGYRQQGETWPDRGNFGVLIRQLPSMSFGGNAFGGGGFSFGGGGGGGFGGGSGGVCPVCHGTGTCTICHGSGSVRQYGQTVACDRACSACGGTGRK